MTRPARAAEATADALDRLLLQRRGALVAVLIGFWTLPGLLFASQIFILYRMEAREISWWQLAVWQLPSWYYWAAATPLILWLGRRLPFVRGRWAGRLLTHLGLATTIELLHAGWGVVLTARLAPEPYSLFPLDKMFWLLLLQRFHIALLIYGGILGIGHGVDYYRKYRERELQSSQLEAQLAQAQLQALKMQLHPHFLFNTLNAISALVRTGSTQHAVSMLAGLSDLLRMALENAGTQEVPLKRELDFLERYLELQQIRFQDRLRVKLDVADETLDASVPNLILQPLVENAIRHGIGSSASAGLVEISARRVAGHLRVEVRDDGPGLRGGGDGVQEEGVGLSNTRKRLERMYGEDHRLELANAARVGALAVLEIPFRKMHS